jgi:excisionase family DNA binding protein
MLQTTSKSWGAFMEDHADSQGVEVSEVSRMRQDDVKVHVLGTELPLSLSVERAARLLGVGRSSMYGAVKRGDIPVTRINGRMVVLTVPLLLRMGLHIENGGHVQSFTGR